MAKKLCRGSLIAAFVLLVSPFGAWAMDAAGGGERVMLFPIVKEGKWGYMDEKGVEVIEPTYDQAFDFSEGLACVVTYPWRGYINGAGKIVIDPQFTWAGPFREGLAPVLVHSKFYGRHANYYGGAAAHAEKANVADALKGSCFIDRSGKPVEDVPFSTSGVAEGKVLLCSRKGTDVYGIDGKEYTHDADKVCQFSQGLAAARKGTRWGYLDHSMKWVIEPQFHEVGEFSEGFAFVGKSDPPPPKVGGEKARRKWLESRKMAWGFIDKSGQFMNESRFEDAWRFSEGLASVRLDGKWGYIDTKGTVVISPKYDYAWPLSEGRGRVMVDEKQGFVTREGELVVAPLYRPAWEFFRGLARVQIKDADGFREGYINKKGDYVWEPTK